ncbi:DUF6234 family protein [Kitasatospora sp. NPDC101183]|uniref:DUF6234 family protein n=1 Tax=Kitasatospora sp. NPDC101183 TaxID=3364100 RepID=UPI003811E4E2
MPGTGPPTAREVRRPARRSGPPAAFDLAVGVLLMVTLALVYVGRMFSSSAPEAARRTASQVAHAHLEFTWGLLLAVLCLAGLAALVRARWTAVLHLVAAGVLLASSLLQA